MPVPRPAGCLRGVLVLAILLLLALSMGCARKAALPGYGYGDEAASGEHALAEAAPDDAAIDPGALPEGWGCVDVACLEGVNKDRGLRDTLFGCLLQAREQGTGVVRLPRGVYLGHVAGFIAKALKFYHIERHFERIYGYRVVMVFRPATPAERERGAGGHWARLGAGTTGEVALTLAGAPLVPIVAPIVFAFEAVDADLEFQRFRKDALARGLPEPTRRGDEIVRDEYAERYQSYWDAVNGKDGQDAQDDVSALYVVERCYLAHPRGDVPLAGR